jgi:DNA-binding XRE family transcriptional regulator
MFFQDWNPVTLKKMGGASMSKLSAKHVANFDPEAKRAKLLDSYNAETPAPKIEKVSAEDKKELTQLRILKKLTQEQLNQQLNLKKDTIKQIENGTHEKNKQLTNKIRAFLSKP